MSTGWILKEMNPADLKNHPVNIEIYGTQPLDDEMLSSVKEFGVFQPIHCTKDGVVLGGHRRRQHAIAAKLKLVPVMMARNAISEPEQVVQIVELNRFREKTMEMKAREYGKLAEAKAVLKAKIKEANLKKGPENPEREKNPTREHGRAKDEAATEVGIGSRKTADAALAVTEKIDELTEAGKAEEAAKLREKLNKGSVSAAAREAGVIQSKSDKPDHTPFDEPLAGVDWVLKIAVPKIQEYAISAERALASGKAGFTADRVSKLVKPIHDAFEGARGVIANAQQRHRRGK